MENKDVKIVSDLTTRQWKLYLFLLKNYQEDSTKYISRKEIYWELRDYYIKPLEHQDWNNAAARRQITEDILALKESKRLHKIILSNAAGVKIARKQEAKDNLKKEIASHLKSLNRIYKQIKKVGLDKQLRIAFNQEKDLIESFLN